MDYQDKIVVIGSALAFLALAFILYTFWRAYYVHHYHAP